MKIVEEIERVKFSLGEYKIRTDPDLFYNAMEKYEEDFYTLNRCYEELLRHLGVAVAPTFMPAFVPPVVRSALTSLFYGNFETTSQ
jgi:hypothetical protein